MAWSVTYPLKTVLKYSGAEADVPEVDAVAALRGIIAGYCEFCEGLCRALAPAFPYRGMCAGFLSDHPEDEILTWPALGLPRPEAS
jgi:hypothetical protein